MILLGIPQEGSFESTLCKPGDHVKKEKPQPIEKVFGRISLRTSGQNSGQALQILENKHCGMDIARVRP